MTLIEIFLCHYYLQEGSRLDKAMLFGITPLENAVMFCGGLAAVGSDE
jgi:hypothetical protein